MDHPATCNPAPLPPSGPRRQDPEGRSPRSRNGVLTFPFVTIENVDWVDKAEATIVVGNVSGGRG